MNAVQKKLLALGQTRDLGSLGLREIGRIIDEHPQTVKYHLQKLNLLEKNTNTHKYLVSIPLYGLANCGEASVIADQAVNENQKLQISPSLVNRSVEGLFAVQAIGDSMNKANVNGKSIENGDYVLVDPADKDFKSGDYVLSVINNLANIKMILVDSVHRQVALCSRSTKNYTPILIHAKDFESYFANGKVVDVLKVKNDVEDIVYDFFAK